MNLRILKKLSKRAAPLLPLLGDGREQFRAGRCDSYIGIQLMDHSSWERGRSVHAELLREHEIKKPAADGTGWIYMAPPSHALKGTTMVGSMSGYEQPEWSEQTAWEALQSCVHAHFTDWYAEQPYATRDFPTAASIFAAAEEMILAKVEAGQPIAVF